MILPACWNPTEGLPPELHRYARRAAFAIHRMHVGMTRRFKHVVKHKGRWKPSARINAELMRDTCCAPGAWDRVRKHWIANGVLHAEPGYMAGVASRRYRLGDELAGRHLETVTINDAKLAQKLRVLRRKWELEQPPIYRR
jgi:hypothetical protein